MRSVNLNGFNWTVVSTDDEGRRLINGDKFYSDASIYLKNILKPGCTVIDAGACFGWYSLEMARIVGNKGFIHSYEPHKGNLTLLTTNVHENSYEGVVKIHRHALGDRKFVAELYSAYVPNKENWCKSFITPPLTKPKDKNDNMHSESVLCDTIDNIHPNDHIHFIKIDVNGFEEFVIDGARDTIDRCRPHILVRVDNDLLSLFGCSSNGLIRKIKNMGYITFPLGLYHACIPFENYTK